MELLELPNFWYHHWTYRSFFQLSNLNSRTHATAPDKQSYLSVRTIVGATGRSYTYIVLTGSEGLYFKLRQQLLVGNAGLEPTVARFQGAPDTCIPYVGSGSWVRTNILQRQRLLFHQLNYPA